MQLNATHFALTWPGGVAITDDPALHVWTVMSQQHQPAPGFGFDSGNNNAVWLSNHTLTMAVSGAVGTVGDRHTDPALLRYTQPLNAVNNGSQWQFAGTIWVGRGLRRGRAECGDYFELGGRKVIMYSWRGYQVRQPVCYVHRLFYVRTHTRTLSFVCGSALHSRTIAHPCILMSRARVCRLHGWLVTRTRTARLSRRMRV